MTREEARAVVAQIANAIVETVRETPRGAPAGVMFLVFQEKGMSLDLFNQITSALVDAGKIRRCGDLFYPGISR
jgi:hypothetical protein